ncbi:N-acetyltransferase [Hymenobacter taeanensis]|uniref:N-acetyltransferase n=1 Tax=Hymenobacter taeanensis TaxID=2735321 RepID=A0A6M6BIS6_9BACT|nr:MULTISPECIES: GNAT family N-acetyltransferase [Hymenobacter]QJX48037.1 N-acetyltransferase [Hymenobacter taeanensis]UOQ82515.1 N-acetyltransferase [Hymenobacter sp. 5414T-23]
MKPEFQELLLVDNRQNHRFELTVLDSTAFIEYQENDEAITVLHTVVPPQLEGQGVGTAIVEETLQTIEARQRLLIPLCPFVKSYLKRHPEWQRLVVPAYLRWFQQQQL